MSESDARRGWGVAQALAATLLLAALLAASANPAAASCCACGACGAGFCVDGVATGPDCAALCLGAGCGFSSMTINDVCAGGCGVVPEQSTATPTNAPIGTATNTPTPTPTQPTATATATATATVTKTATGTVTETATITMTPSISPTASVTPTPPQCCQCPASSSCGQPISPSNCAAGCTLHLDSSCDSHAGGSNQCVVNTATLTPSLTPTQTPTVTLTFTPTATFTATPTRTATETPRIPDHIDPYKCYRVKASDHLPKRVVVIVDQFERKRSAVLKPYLLCNPSVRFAEPTPSSGPGITPTAGPSPTPTPLALKNPVDHLVCYKVKDENKPTTQPKFNSSTKVKIRNEVVPGEEVEETFDVLKSELVCLPSTKAIIH